MSAVALNRVLSGSRRRLACIAMVLSLGAIVAVHHTPSNHMGMDTAMVMCLAMLPAVVLAAAAVFGGMPDCPRFRVAPLWPRVVRLAAPPLPRARSSPEQSAVLRL